MFLSVGLLLLFLSLFGPPSQAWSPVPSFRRSSPVRGRSGRLFTSIGNSPVELESVGFNELHSLLRDAVREEDYVEAGLISDIVLKRLYGDDSSMSDEEKRSLRRKMSWRGLGAAPWLTERLDALNYTFPTTIQINSMLAVNAILNSTDERVESASLEERVDMSDKDLGIVISGATGAGKTLAYLVPLLSTLSDSLFKRQRIRVGAEEIVGETTGDMLDRVAIVTSPVVRSNSRRKTREAGAIAMGASLSTLGESGRDVKSPLALIVVPTRELGVQIAMLLYQLIGGNIKDSPTERSGKANMFKYRGPKGVRIGCILDDEEASFGLKLQTDIAVTTPQYIGKLIDDDDVTPTKLRVVVYDEADLDFELTSAKELAQLFDDDADEREYTRLTLLVGASVTEALGSLAVSSRILPEGKSYIASATSFAPLRSEAPTDTTRLSGEEPKAASLKDLKVCLYPGLKHERAIAPEDTGLLVLARLLRKELRDFEKKLESGVNPKELQRPRVVVFFPDEAQARAAIVPLRDALWGEHKLCVLLPKTGERPLDIMEQFKKNETTVMLATPNSVRGLDFPALSHVYAMYLPMDDPREYVHLAGRVGRVGQQGCVLGDGAHVVSILKPEEADMMESLSKTLAFEFTDLDTSSFDIVPRGEDGSIDGENADVEVMRELFEDTATFLQVDDLIIDVNAVREGGEIDEEDKDDDDDDDDSYQ